MSRSLVERSQPGARVEAQPSVQPSVQPGMQQNVQPGDVWLFSGQGSQRPGMGADVLDIPEVAEVFACAAEVSGIDVARLCREASEAELSRTKNAQIALVTLSVAFASICRRRNIVPQAVLGFSLGQISALYACGMLTEADTFSLVSARADCMARAAEDASGAMCAVLGLSHGEVEALCAECAGQDTLVPANYNSPVQTVVSGDERAVERMESVLRERGVRFVRLSTQGAFHSPLMSDAAREFANVLQSFSFAEPDASLLCNVDAQPLSAHDAARHLELHLTSPVLFEQSVASPAVQGCRSFVEMGQGGVLLNLVKRIDRSAVRQGVFDRAGLEAYLAQHDCAL